MSRRNFERIPVQTNWERFVPVDTTGFGTLASSNLWWRRNGPDLLIKGTFVAGTVTASEARIDFPGIGIVTARWLPTLQMAGFLYRTTTTNKGAGILVEPNQSYMVFGDGALFSESDFNPLNKVGGSAVLGNGETGVIDFNCPIESWTANRRGR